MDPLRRTCAASLALGLLASPTALLAATDHSADGPFGKLDPPVPPDAAGKIEVIEFFWYGCPHCAKVEPSVEAWEKRLPADVLFRREHIVWPGRAQTQAHAQLFATLRILNMAVTSRLCLTPFTRSESTSRILRLRRIGLQGAVLTGLSSSRPPSLSACTPWLPA